MKLEHLDSGPMVLTSILTDDYGQLAALTLSDWWEPMGAWFEYIVSDETLHHVWRERSDE